MAPRTCGTSSTAASARGRGAASSSCIRRDPAARGDGGRRAGPDRDLQRGDRGARGDVRDEPARAGRRRRVAGAGLPFVVAERPGGELAGFARVERVLRPLRLQRRGGARRVRRRRRARARGRARAAARAVRGRRARGLLQAHVAHLHEQCRQPGGPRRGGIRGGRASSVATGASTASGATACSWSGCSGTPRGARDRP